MNHFFPQLVSLTKLQSWVKDISRQSTKYFECYQVLTVLYWSGNRVGGRSTVVQPSPQWLFLLRYPSIGQVRQLLFLPGGCGERCFLVDETERNKDIDSPIWKNLYSRF